jgi:hypothetical protein
VITAKKSKQDVSEKKHKKKSVEQHVHHVEPKDITKKSDFIPIEQVIERLDREALQKNIVFEGPLNKKRNAYIDNLDHDLSGLYKAATWKKNKDREETLSEIRR